jgi:predicted nuclease of restriction endonuclease-like RecB superfamily
MLTRELAIVEYDSGRVWPDRLTRRQHARYEEYARRMLLVYQHGVGRTRRDLHRSVHAIFAGEPDCPLRRIDAFCKLLDDAGRFDRDRRGRAAELRRQVFQMAAPSHPLVTRADRLFEHNETEVKRSIAESLGTTWDEIDGRLFSDVIEFHRLQRFAGYTDGRALLAHYNVAQVQVALFDAVEMTVRCREDFKTVLRYAKLAKLMHTIRRAGDDGYAIRFDGPASLLRETRRYGTRMARFLPALIACHGWRMNALVRSPSGWSNRLELSPADGLTSRMPPPDEFDSDVEAAFAKKWGTEPREGWTLAREAEILHRGQHVFVPDFLFRHTDGRRGLLEIVGYWTPEYLEAKLKTLASFAGEPIILAVAEHIGRDSTSWPEGTMRFKTVLKIKEVLERLRREW